MLPFDDATLFSVGGELDSDGSVAVYSGRLIVLIKKSVKSKTLLEKYQSMFGGTVTLADQRSSNWEIQWAWCIRAEAARQFCKDIVSFVFAKRPQFELASTLVVGRTPLIAKRGDVTRAFCSFEELTNELQLGEAANVRRRFVKNTTRLLQGWTIYRLDKASILAYRQEVDQKLRAMKNVPHLPYPCPQDIHLAYYCAFVEGDGTVAIRGPNQYHIAVSQKFRAVCDAFQTKFGGSVICTQQSGATLGHIWIWYMYTDAYCLLLHSGPLPIRLRKRGTDETCLEQYSKNLVRYKRQAKCLERQTVREVRQKDCR